MFKKFPHLRSYFAGRENYAPEDVQNDPFFKVQGKNILLAIHLIASTIDNEPTFKALAHDLLDRHLRRNIILDPTLWKVDIY